MDAFAASLLADLRALPAVAVQHDLPAYDASSVSALSSVSSPQSFRVGTGASIFAATLLPALLAAQQEIVIVTCFWAPSRNRDDLAAALTQLAAARQQKRQDQQDQQDRAFPPLRVRICLSSRTLAQKLLHPASAAGYVYPPASWAPVLGLPAPDVLAGAGIDLSVKSLFFRPFSVMHPKLVLVDRRRAFLPSCNVSWESWLECCVELTGPAVQPLLTFYARTWSDDLPPLAGTGPGAGDAQSPVHMTASTTPVAPHISPLDIDGPASIVVRFATGTPPLATIVLPSSHHRNPSFRPLPWQSPPPPPPTPLNLALLRLFAAAQVHIFCQTPNLTAEPVQAALLQALGRGVNVDLVTGRHMMVLEQIVTAGTTTARCLRRWTRRYDALRAANPGCGQLRVWYFRPLWPRSPGSPMRADEEQAILPPAAVDTHEPVHSHVKLTIVDHVFTVLGSGNLDRASWFTSQELGVLFHNATFAAAVRTAVDRALDGRLEPVYVPGTA